MGTKKVCVLLNVNLSELKLHKKCIVLNFDENFDNESKDAVYVIMF